MDKNMLRSIMVRHGDTQENLADKIGLSLSRFNAKFNETGGAEFSKSEIIAISKVYNLKDREIINIFFADNVSR